VRRGVWTEEGKSEVYIFDVGRKTVKDGRNKEVMASLYVSKYVLGMGGSCRLHTAMPALERN